MLPCRATRSKSHATTRRVCSDELVEALLAGLAFALEELDEHSEQHEDEQDP